METNDDETKDERVETKKKRNSEWESAKANYKILEKEIERAVETNAMKTWN